MRLEREPAPMPGRPSISLHVARLVVDEALLTAGGEQALRHALVEALEQVLPGAVAGGFRHAAPTVDGSPAGPAPGRAPLAATAAGQPGGLAMGVAGTVAEHVQSALGGTRSARSGRTP